MKIKYTLFIPMVALATFTLPSALFAQATPAPVASPGAAPKFGDEGSKGGPGGRKEWKRDPEARLARLKEALGLTPEQEVKIRDILKTEAEKLKAERQANKGTPLTPEERRTKMKAAREEVDASIATVLTPEQKAKYDAMKAKIKERRDEAGTPPAAPVPAP